VRAAIPEQTSRNASQIELPHCPGETQTSPEVSSSATIAKLAGLKKCLRCQRIRNFEPIASTAAATHSNGRWVRSSRLSDNPVMNGLRQSNDGSAKSRTQTNCAASAAAIVTAACSGLAPRSNQSA
jgi:hypothetical protein